MLLFLVIFVLMCVALVFMNIPFLIIFIPPLKGKKRQLTFRIQSKMSGQIARCCSTGSGGHSGLHVNTKVGHFMFVQNEEEREKTCVGTVHDRVLKYKHLLVGLRDLWMLTRAY